MIATWKSLSKSRRKKGQASTWTLESVPKLVPVDKKSWHKTGGTSVGILSLDARRNLILSGGCDKTAVLYDRGEKKIRSILSGAGEEITHVGLFLKDDAPITLAASADGTLRQYRNDELVSSLPLPEGETVIGLHVQPTGNYLLLATNARVLFLSLSPLHTLATFSSTPNACSALHPDGLILAVGGVDGLVSLWDLKTRSLASTLGEAGAPATHCAFSENGYHFAVCRGEEVLVWDLRKLKVVGTIKAQAQVRKVVFDPIGKFLLYATADGVLTVVVAKDWNREIVVLNPVEKSTVNDVIWKDWGIATCGDDRLVRFWGLQEDDQEQLPDQAQ